MIQYNISTFLDAFPKDTFENLSKGKNKSKQALVTCKTQGYNFDDIAKALNAQSITSADSIFIKGNKIYLIEFKSGFKKKITPNNFQKEKMFCPKIKDENYYCKEYGKLFFKNQKNESDILFKSIHMKAIESFFVVDKLILPKCPTDENEYELIYCAVVDANSEDPIDIIESTIFDLSETPSSEGNDLSRLQSSLMRFIVSNDSGNHILYDSVAVMDKEEFDIFFKCN